MSRIHHGPGAALSAWNTYPGDARDFTPLRRMVMHCPS